MMSEEKSADLFLYQNYCRAKLKSSLMGDILGRMPHATNSRHINVICVTVEIFLANLIRYSIQSVSFKKKHQSHKPGQVNHQKQVTTISTSPSLRHRLPSHSIRTPLLTIRRNPTTQFRSVSQLDGNFALDFFSCLCPSSSELRLR